MNASVLAESSPILIQTKVRNFKMAERDELLDISVHALTALMNSRKSENVDVLLDECVGIAQKLIEKVDKAVEGK